MVSPVPTLPIRIISDLGDVVQVRLSVRGIVVAMPHDVIGISAFSFAVWMVAKVASVYSSSFKAVWRAYAPGEDGFQESSVLHARSVCEPGAFSGEV